MKSILTVITILASAQVFAFEFTTTAVVGARMNQAVSSGLSSKDQTGVDAGVVIHVPMVDGLSLRTGAILAMKDTKLEAANGQSGTAQRLFLNVPVAAQLGHGILSWYLGADVSAKISTSCSADGVTSCEIKDEQSVVFYPIAGVDVVVVDNFNVGGFYEFETEYSENYKQSGYGLRVGYKF